MGPRDGRGRFLNKPTPGRIDTEVVYTGRVVRLSVDTVRFPDGSQGRLEMIRHVGASAVLPFLGSLSDPDPDSHPMASPTVSFLPARPYRLRSPTPGMNSLPR